MSYVTEVFGDTVVAEAEGILEFDESFSVSDRIVELANAVSAKSIVVDYRRASFNMSLEQSIAIGHRIVHAANRIEFPHAIVVMPEDQAARSLLDVSVMIAINRGVDIRVCRNVEEAQGRLPVFRETDTYMSRIQQIAVSRCELFDTVIDRAQCFFESERDEAVRDALAEEILHLCALRDDAYLDFFRLREQTSGAAA